MIKKIALAGNPNVGKSTIFNSLTGLHQHTGNWTGKTISNKKGIFKTNKNEYEIYDLPGTYSLLSHSYEEKVARDFICFQRNDYIVIVCDATCLVKNLNLVLQILEITDNVLVCINQMDEAKRKNITIDIKKLEEILGTKVIGLSAKKKNESKKIIEEIEKSNNYIKKSYTVKYNDIIEKSIKIIEDKLDDYNLSLNKRWLSLKLLLNDNSINKTILENINLDIREINNVLELSRNYLIDNNIDINNLDEYIVERINEVSNDISKKVVKTNKKYNDRDKKIDRFLTNKYTGFPMILLLFGIVFWITLIGSNYPSSFLQKLLFSFEENIISFLKSFNLSYNVIDLLVNGVYHVLSWVVSVMLPPMAIFFPLFSILEESGYLPRIAFNLDSIFKKCSSCGKQALTMLMGFGCNAVGVSGCRIIDSKRERLIAIITNVFVPCNGRFPFLIAIISIFLSSNSILSVLILLLFILFGIIITFIVSKLLSKTILKGYSSSFILELPSYKKPNFLKTIIYCLKEKIIKILIRAVVVSIPAGIIIWLMSNILINNQTILSIVASYLDPFGKLLGMDGVIILAFILGFPANEIVLPIIIMGYLSSNGLIDISNLNDLKDLLIQNGWTIKTAISVMIFSLIHFPCSTTCLTIKKETSSWKWTILSILIPTIIGITICILFNTFINIFL